MIRSVPYLTHDINKNFDRLALLSVVYLALSERGCEIFRKRHSNKMTKFLLIVYFHGTESY